MRERFPHIANPPKEDICYATQNRQEAVKLLVAEADVVLVLGSQNSSNSQRLAELSIENNVPAYLIDGAADIDLGWFRGDETVLVTAGASAPELVVEDCVEFLRALRRHGRIAQRARGGSSLPAAERIANRVAGQRPDSQQPGRRQSDRSRQFLTESSVKVVKRQDGMERAGVLRRPVSRVSASLLPQHFFRVQSSAIRE